MNRNNAPNNTMHEPKPLFFQGNAEPVAWVCGKCKAIYGDRAEAVHCCNPSKCRECRAESVDSGLSWERCAACEAKRAARRRQSKRRALEAWRAQPNRAPISTHEGMISDADYSEGEDGDGGGYFQDLEHLIEHCVDGGPNPRNLRLFATAKTRVDFQAESMADDFIERLGEEAYDDWSFDGRAELVRLLEPVAALLNGQDIGYHQDNSRPLDFDLPWPPPPSEPVSKRERVIHPIGAVMVRDGKVFAAKRAPHKAAGGLWEFPGGKPEGDESNEAALARELREEFGIEATVGEWITRGTITDGDPTNDDGYLRIELDLYLARWTGGEFVLTDHSEAGWFSVKELEALEWCPADACVLYRVTEAIEEQEP